MLAWSEENWRGAEQAGAGWAEAAFAGPTRVATAMGWRAAEALAPGDLVLTFDNGMQPLVAVERTWLWSGKEAALADWPLFVPEGALGNLEPMWLLPGQDVLIESDAAERLWGDPFAVVPAMALDGFRGIARVRPAGALTAVRLVFEEDEVVFAGTGAMVLCPAGGDLLSWAEGPYPVLSLDDADLLLSLAEAGEGRAAALPMGSAAAA